eukprot:2275837-Rhodomonas_salina.1
MSGTDVGCVAASHWRVQHRCSRMLLRLVHSRRCQGQSQVEEGGSACGAEEVQEKSLRLRERKEFEDQRPKVQL